MGDALPDPVVSGLIVRVEEHERRLTDGAHRMERIEEGVQDIRNGLLRRPSWAVMMIVTVLATISTGLIVGVVVAGLK